MYNLCICIITYNNVFNGNNTAAPGGVAVRWTASDPAGLGSNPGLGRWFGEFQR